MQSLPRHPHKDMEIITYLLKGVLKHEDGMGNSSLMRVTQVRTTTTPAWSLIKKNKNDKP